MTQFTLNIRIDIQGITSLTNAQMSVTILQEVPNSEYLVIAILAKPAQNMKITWDDSVFYVCTSSQPLENYTTLSINNSLEALAGNLYSFDGSVIESKGQGLQGSVQIQNKNSSDTKNPVTVGLANSFTVNGIEQPLAITTAASVLFNGLATFQISNNFLLTVLSESQVSTVIPRQIIPNVLNFTPMAFFVNAAQPALLLKFSDGNPNQSVTYNTDQNAFIPES